MPVPPPSLENLVDCPPAVAVGIQEHVTNLAASERLGLFGPDLGFRTTGRYSDSETDLLESL